MSEETNDAATTESVESTTEATPETTESPNTETTSAETPATTTEPTAEPSFGEAPTPGTTLSQMFANEDGSLNKEAIDKHESESKTNNEAYEKRINDLRRTVSKGEAPEDKEGYFLDYAPPEKYMKFFDPQAPDETKEVMGQITESLAQKYHDTGLSKTQADSISVAFLETMESLGVLDARTQTEKSIDKQEWIDDQKKLLGNNADNLIRETQQWVETNNVFSAKTKRFLINAMESQGAEMIDSLQQMKASYGVKTGGVPVVNVSNLSGLPDDAELKAEYLDPKTTDARREAIHSLRAKDGRMNMLMDA